MMTLDQIREALQDRNCSAVGRATGMTAAYVALIRSGKAKNPSYYAVKKLSDYFEQSSAKTR